MAFLPWHDRYNVGHAELDTQHQQLFELVNHFDDVIPMGMPAELGLIVDDLIRITRAHFTFEETLMQNHGFPGMAEHTKMHGELIRQLQDMRVRMSAGGHESSKSIARFLADWLTNHILREDMAYRPYLKG